VLTAVGASGQTAVYPPSAENPLSYKLKKWLWRENPFP
jgi:hypothetical protein